jgi:hypothetical protein
MLLRIAFCTEIQRKDFKMLSSSKRILVAGLTLATLSFAACNKGGDSGGGGATPGAPAAAGTFATTPQPCNTQQVSGQACNGQAYNGQLPNSWQYGAWQWPTQWQPSYGNCGCTAGMTAVYYQSFGMACAPNAYLSNQNNGYNNYGYSNNGYNNNYGGGFNVQFNWGWNFGPSQNTQGNNIPQTNYSNTYNNSCGQQSVARGCDVRTANACGYGYCQPVGGGSTIGICIDGGY